MKTAFFIFGLGYTASFFAEKLATQGIKTVGTTRHLKKRDLHQNKWIHAIDFYDTNIGHYLSQATHLLISIPPDPQGADLVLQHYKSLIEKNCSSIQWIGYLSSTGVYGDHQGQWVDEESVCTPQSLTSRVRLNAENDWRHFAKQRHLPLHIYRLAGIYGPGRNALERIIAGKSYSLYKKEHVFSRIHVEDIVAILIASIKNTSLFSLYNVADDEPCAPHLLDAYACSLLNYPSLPLLNIEDATLSAREKEFYSANRRVLNTKIKQELHLHLKYPSYREGLNAIWKSYLKKEKE